MTRLTEEMVIARSKQSDLSAIKKLNCWGSDLTDVSILKKMRGVEVLALSVNQISTLQDFVNCTKLQDLYLRKNKIEDINEIGYLRVLPALKNLWLEENPCVETYGENYRSIIIRFLPNLKKLDNIEISNEEREKALSPSDDYTGKDDEVYEDSYAHDQQNQNYQQINTQNTTYPQENYNTQQPRRSLSSAKEEQVTPSSPKYAFENEPTVRNSCQSYEQSVGPEQENMPKEYRENAHHIPASMSTQSMKEFYNTDRPSFTNNYRHSQSDLTEWEEPAPHYGSQAQLQYGQKREMNDRVRPRVQSGRETGEWDEHERPRSNRIERRPEGGRYDSTNNMFNHHFTQCHRRPINRNSNLLSATLCLVKELDYNSLEVVEHAVRCRFDELSVE